MAVDPRAHFPADYTASRDAFRRAAERRGAAIESHVLSRRGPRGEELAVDTAFLGPASPERVMVLSSGVHGVEGYAGAAIQHRLLAEQLQGVDLSAGTGVLVVHAVNPFGFAATRRVNESNVDLNRNFLRHPEDHVPNPDYGNLCAHINPADLDEATDAAAMTTLMGYADAHGFPRLQAVLTAGQYEFPSGVQFGGGAAEDSNGIVREIARSATRGARHVAWVDLHTGLGPYAEVEMIAEYPTDAPSYLRGRAWYGESVQSTHAGDSVSAALHGTIDRGVEQSLPEGVDLTIHTAEFGTFDPLRVFRAMRADNWLHHHGDAESEAGRAIKAELLEVFRPGDAAWQAAVLETGARLVEESLRGLAAPP